MAAKPQFGQGYEVQVVTPNGDSIMDDTLDAQKVTDIAGTSGGCTAHRTISAATTNATVVKASAGQLYTLHVGNINAAARYLKFYNKATTPSEVDAPVHTFTIPATGVVTLSWEKGLAFSAGISFRLVTGIADNDTVAVAANEHIVNLGFK